MIHPSWPVIVSAGAVPAIRSLLHDSVTICETSEATCWVLLGDGDYLLARLTHGLSSATLEGVKVPLLGTIVGLVAMTGMGTVIGPKDPHNSEVDAVTGVPTRDMAAVPIRVRGVIWGVVSTINSGNTDQMDSSILERLGHQARNIGKVLEDLGDE